MSSYIDEQIRKIWASTQNNQEPKPKTEASKLNKVLEEIETYIVDERILGDEVFNPSYKKGYNDALKKAYDIVDSHKESEG